MTIVFLAIGKTNEPYIRQGTEEFTKRISNYYKVKWQFISPPRNAGQLTDAELKKKETALILHQLSKDDFLIALDEKGKTITSLQFAQFLQEKTNTGMKNMFFLIGGAYGLDQTILNRANLVMSLSAFTFPHQLVRLILAEQVYRACTIQRNEKYHHS